MEGMGEMHISANSQSSSLLPMLGEHVRAVPGAAFIRSEQVKLTTIDEAIRRHVHPEDRVLVKLDTQGYEREILKGLREAESLVSGLQVEMSLTPLYDGEALIEEMIALLRSRGFTLVALEPGYSDPVRGHLLQADGIFFRT
jgi:hypothetical protein